MDDFESVLRLEDTSCTERAATHSRIVAQNVNRTLGCQPACGKRFDAADIRHVNLPPLDGRVDALFGRELLAFLDHGLRMRFMLGRVSTCENDIGATFGELQRSASTDAVVAATNDDPFPVELRVREAGVGKLGVFQALATFLLAPPP